jgi:RimJ/RimL family protein N-acetyltransferase
MQIIGPVIENLPTGTAPDHRPLHGRWVRLEKLSVARHGLQLWASVKDADASLWTYMPYGPFASEEQFLEWLKGRAEAKDIWFYAYVDRTSGLAKGMGAFMRHDPPNGVIEIGNIWFSPDLQRTRQATEIIYLMMRHAFDDMGLRRFEWKCDANNEPSRRAAKRFGFDFEGIFRQHMIIKSRNRDTAWFAIIDKDWPRLHRGFETWLDDLNFDMDGKQKAPLQLA